MINLMNLANITNDEKSLLRCVADRLENQLTTTRLAMMDPNNIDISKHYLMGNYLVPGALVFQLQSDSIPVEIPESVECVNALTGALEEINLDELNNEFADAIQGAEVICMAVRAAASDGVSSVSDFLQVLNTKVASTVTGLTSNTKTILNSITSYVSSSGESIVNGLASFFSTLEAKLKPDGEIDYSAKGYLGVNPFISGFSHMDILDVTINVVTTVLGIVVSCFAGAVGLLVKSAADLLWNIAKYAMKGVTNPVDVYTRNMQAKPMFDRSGHDITYNMHAFSDLDMWEFAMPNDSHYVFYLPSGELHVMKRLEPNGGAFDSSPYVTIRVIRYSLSTPNGYATSNSAAVNSFTSPIRDGHDAQFAINSAAQAASTAVLSLSQDNNETNLFSWAVGKQNDTVVLNSIVGFNSNNEYLGNYLLRLNQVCCMFGEFDPNSYPVYFPGETNSRYQWMSMCRGPIGMDPDHTYTNNEWFRSMYTRHVKGLSTDNSHSTEYPWCELTNEDLIKVSNGYRGYSIANDHMNEMSFTNDRDAQRRAALFWHNLAGICMIRLTGIWDDVTATVYGNYQQRVKARIYNLDWIDDSWCWERVLTEDRGAYAIYTDEQNATRAGRIYSAIIIGTAALTATIAANVARGQLRKKAYSAQRKLDIMAFDEKKTDKECRWQGVKASFWSGLSGYGTGSEDVLNSGSSLLDTLKSVFSNRDTENTIDESATSITASIKGSSSVDNTTVSSEVNDVSIDVQRIIELIK